MLYMSSKNGLKNNLKKQEPNTLFISKSRERVKLPQPQAFFTSLVVCCACAEPFFHATRIEVK